MKSHVVIFNRAPLASRDGWIHIVPKGELANAEAGIVQVLDDSAMDSILAGIEKDKNRLGDRWPGIYAGREHFIYDSDKDSAALAWFKDFEKRGDGIWAKDDGLTPAGADAVKNREYKFTSFVSDPKQLQKIEGKRYRITGIETVGFTNQANGKELLTPITNRGENLDDASSSAAASNQQQQIKNKMKNIAVALGLDPNTDEQSIVGVVTKLMNRGDITAADLTTLKNRKTELETENQTLLGEQVDGIIAEHKITDTKVVNRLKPVLAACKNREERLATLLDFGFKPGESKTTTAARVLNRGKGDAAANQQENQTDEQALAAENIRSKKVMNRAQQLMKETPTLGLATATQMANAEITA